MSNLNINIERTEGVKCPRCWRFCGIPENPLGICDRCAFALVASNPEDYFEAGSPEAEGFVNFQQEIKSSYFSQAYKYGKV